MMFIVKGNVLIQEDEKLAAKRVYKIMQTWHYNGGNIDTAVAINPFHYVTLSADRKLSVKSLRSSGAIQMNSTDHFGPKSGLLNDNFFSSLIKNAIPFFNGVFHNSTDHPISLKEKNIVFLLF
jgi:hypothetical protein